MTIYSEHKPYTYLIGWTKYNVWYYGVRFAKHCQFDDLWHTYFTSSSSVHKFMGYVWPDEPDVIEIRHVFCNIDAARNWEHKVLKRMRVVHQSKWLNRTDNKAFDAEACKARGRANKGKKRTKTPEQIEKNRAKTKGSRRHFSDEHKQAMSLARKNSSVAMSFALKNIQLMATKTRDIPKIRCSCVRCHRDITINVLPKHHSCNHLQ